MKKLIQIITRNCMILSLLIFFLPAYAESNVSIAKPETPAYMAHANPNAHIETTEETIDLNDTLKIVPSHLQEESAELHYNIDITYPKIIGDHLSPEAITFNTRIHDIVVRQIQTFKNNIKQDLAHMQSLPLEAQNNSFKLDYDIDVFHPGNLSLISVRLSMEGFQAGRAHPYHSHQVLNFDFTHGQELALKDLFKINAAYLPVLAKFSNKELNQSLKNHDTWMIAEGTKPELKNYKNWNIEEDAILITFDEYQVAPYYYGTLEVEIPYTELQSILSAKAMIISRLDSPTKKKFG